MSANNKRPGRFYSVPDVQTMFFPSRSLKWIRNTFRGGAHGPVMRMGKGWEISELAIQTFQQQHLVGPGSEVTTLPHRQQFAHDFAG